MHKAANVTDLAKTHAKVLNVLAFMFNQAMHSVHDHAITRVAYICRCEWERERKGERERGGRERKREEDRGRKG